MYSRRAEHLFYVKKRRRPFFEAHQACACILCVRVCVCLCFDSIVFLTTDRIISTHTYYLFRSLSPSLSLSLCPAMYTYNTRAHVCVVLFLSGGYVPWTPESVFSSTLFFVRVVCLVGRISSKTHRQGDGWHLFRFIFRWRECCWKRTRFAHTAARDVIPAKVGVRWLKCSAFSIEILKSLVRFCFSAFCVALSSTSLFEHPSAAPNNWRNYY